MTDANTAPDHANTAPAEATAEAAVQAPVQDAAVNTPTADNAVDNAADGAPQGKSRSRRGRRGGRGGRDASAADGAAGDAAAVTAPADKSAGDKAGRGGAQARGPRKVSPVLERLFELYPGLFGARFLPLKRGVYEDLIARHPNDFKAEDLKIAMGQHARSTRYLEAVAAGHPRHDLEGNVVEAMAPEHVHHAIVEIFKRRQSRTGDDLGAQLRTRLVAAIEASGLKREDYALRMRSREDTVNAAIDDAVAEVGRLSAKREALLRAFEASGKTEAEFADMYGMAPKETARTLAAARRDRAAASQATEEAQAAMTANPAAEAAPDEATETEGAPADATQDASPDDEAAPGA